MNSLLGLIIQIINLYQFILLIYIIATWLLNFNIINSSNRFVYSIMEAMYRLCEPSLNLVRRYRLLSTCKLLIVLEEFKNLMANK